MNGWSRRRQAPPQQCVDRVRKEFDYSGADAVIMHGATPDELAPIVEAYRASA